MRMVAMKGPPHAIPFAIHDIEVGGVLRVGVLYTSRVPSGAHCGAMFVPQPGR
jgi:hypothetical protein